MSLYHVFETSNRGSFCKGFLIYMTKFFLALGFFFFACAFYTHFYRSGITESSDSRFELFILIGLKMGFCLLFGL